MSKTPKPSIGWREWVALPGLGIPRVKAKVDTGARSSSLHASNVSIRIRGEHKYVYFDVHPLQDDSELTVHCRTRLHDERYVRSSNGKRELRPVIRTAVSLGGERWDIDLTLTSRDAMGFRMLLGREAIRRRLLVDAGRSFLMPEHKPTKKKKTKKKKTKKRVRPSKKKRTKSVGRADG